MNNSKVYKKTIKFISKEASESEWEELDALLRNEDSIAIFNRLVRIEYLISLCMKKYDLAEAKKAVQIKLKKEKQKIRLLYFKRISIAASVLILLAVSVYKIDWSDPYIEKPIPVEIVKSGSSKAILTLEDGSEIALEKGNNYKTKQLVSNGEEVFYTSKSTKEDTELAYNYLTIPRGGQFFLRLSDGTKVWLNSESKLKYPTSFAYNKPRHVELIYGEAYFEVSSSKNNNGTSFHVQTKQQNLGVLGTEFNVRSLKNKSEIITTLVGGEITIDNSHEKIHLLPNQQSVISGNASAIVLNEVDTSLVTAWVEGLFIFEDASLDSMMDDLSRWYDIEVFFESQKLKDIPFTGVLERTKSLNTLLKIIEASNKDEMEFEIKNNVLIIK